MGLQQIFIMIVAKCLLHNTEGERRSLTIQKLPYCSKIKININFSVINLPEYIFNSMKIEVSLTLETNDTRLQTC